MADFSILKQQIAAALPENTEGEITATIMVAQFLAAIDAINTAKADQGDLDALAGVVAGKMPTFGIDEYGGLKWITDGGAFDLSVDYEMVQAAIPDLAEIRQNAASPLHWLTGEAQLVEEGRIYTGTGILAAPGEFEVIKCYAVNYTNTAQTITFWRYPDTGSNAQTFTLAPFQVLALTCTIDDPQGSIWTASDSHYQRDAEVFVATYGVTTAQEIIDAYNAGKSVICNYASKRYTLSNIDSSNVNIVLSSVTLQYFAYVQVNKSTDNWTNSQVGMEILSHKQTTPPSASDLASTNKYPSMKIMADYVDEKLGDIEILLAAI